MTPRLDAAGMPYAAPMDSADSASALAWPLSMFDDPALTAGIAAELLHEVRA